jgi:hypothetical protein
MLEPQGVVTVCSGCGRAQADGELFGDPCDCGGLLNQHEDALQLEIGRLQGIAATRSTHEVTVGEELQPPSDETKEARG